MAAAASENDIVLVGRLAESRSDLRDTVCEALEEMDHPNAVIVLDTQWAAGKYPGPDLGLLPVKENVVGPHAPIPVTICWLEASRKRPLRSNR